MTLQHADVNAVPIPQSQCMVESAGDDQLGVWAESAGEER